MGPQPPLPLPDQDRRSESNPLPRPRLTAPPLTPSVLLPHRDFPLDPARPLAPSVLAPHQWQSKGHCRLGDPAKPIPSRPRSRLHSPLTIREP